MPFHSLRHSCASFHLITGTSPRVVQEILGHSRIQTTLDIYSHVMPGLKEEAAKNLDRIFG